MYVVEQEGGWVGGIGGEVYRVGIFGGREVWKLLSVGLFFF